MARLKGRVPLLVLLSIVATVVALGLLARVALPFFISAESVRTEMEEALSSWSGATATIGGDPELTFWPHPKLTLHAVRFDSGTRDAPEELATADTISAGFNVLGTLRGAPLFSDFQLINPVFRIERQTNRQFNWQRSGWLAEAVAGGDSAQSALSRTLPIGEITIVNGTLDVTDRIRGLDRHFAGINGTIDWPTPQDAVHAALTMAVNGEALRLTFDCSDPMTLLAGRNAAIDISVTSTPVNFTFEGIANGSAYPFAAGRLGLTATSLSAIARKHPSAQQAPATQQGPVTLDTVITMAGDTLKMDNLTLSIGPSSATGVLDVSWTIPDRPHLGGTLAFDQLDLAPLVDPFLPMLRQFQAGIPSGSASIGNPQIDLRLSAQEARFSKIALTDVAAGLMVENGRASLDIGDSTYAGGTLSGRLEISDQGGQARGALRRADLGVLAADLGLAGPLPLGRGTLSIDLSTPPRLSEKFVNGTVNYDVTDGVLTHFNGAEFERLVGLGSAFSAAQAADGSFAFSSASLQATIKNGDVELTRAEIIGEGRSLSLSGMASSAAGGMALTGTIRPVDATQTPVDFLIGGAWPDLVVSPSGAIPER